MKIRLSSIIGVTVILIGLSTVWASETGIAHFTKIRMDYAKRPDFDPVWDQHDDRKKITKLWDEGKIDEGMKLPKNWKATTHNKHPVDAEMNLWYAYFLRKTNDFQGYFSHKHLHQELLASITSSGSGLSADSLMKVISVSEKYYVLRALDAKIGEQLLITTKTGAPCDEIVCEIGGKKVRLYFDVTIPMQALNKPLLTQNWPQNMKMLRKSE